MLHLYFLCIPIFFYSHCPQSKFTRKIWKWILVSFSLIIFLKACSHSCNLVLLVTSKKEFIQKKKKILWLVHRCRAKKHRRKKIKNGLKDLNTSMYPLCILWCQDDIINYLWLVMLIIEMCVNSNVWHYVLGYIIQLIIKDGRQLDAHSVQRWYNAIDDLISTWRHNIMYIGDVIQLIKRVSVNLMVHLRCWSPKVIINWSNKWWFWWIIYCFTVCALTLNIWLYL